MVDNVTAEIIAIGTELLLGEIVDTNSVYLAKTLRDLGINLYFMTTVGDNEGRIENAIRLALQRAHVVITCGGLGPTVDDMTRQGVARATDRGLTFHQSLLDEIAARFSNFRVSMPENNKRQAYLPDKAIVVENPVGTAPSFIVEHNQGVVISLPGVPREMKYLMMNKIMPYLRDTFNLGIIVARVLHTAGIGESALDDLLGSALLEHSNPSVGLAAHHGCVDIRITAKADNETLAHAMLDEIEREVQSRVGRHIFGKDGARIEQVVTELLQQKQLHIAVIEAGVGSPISSRLRTTSSDDSHIKHNELLDNPDAVRARFGIQPEIDLRDCASQIAEHVTTAYNVQATIVVISHPDMAENADIEQATALAIHYTGKTRSRVYGFGAQAEVAQEWITTWCLAALWRIIHDSEDPSD